MVKIDKDGNLCVSRAGLTKTMACRYTNFNKPCCDMCPSFKEPLIQGELVMIELCCGDRVDCSKNEFTDERGKDVS
jgi:hypothetical protein